MQPILDALGSSLRIFCVSVPFNLSMQSPLIANEHSDSDIAPSKNAGPMLNSVAMKLHVCSHVPIPIP
jgi:hypothetical protein